MAVTDYMDIDANGLETDSGVAKEYFGEAAIKNAFSNYLASDPGEILYYPYAGGAISQLLQKGMNATQLSDIQQAILRSIENDFPGITVQALAFTPDYENNILQLDIIYTIQGTTSNITVYFDKQLNQSNYSYTNISYTEENLFNFCISVKSTMSGIQLGLDSALNKFRWGNYIFTNFSPTDPYFDQIYAFCNS